MKNHTLVSHPLNQRFLKTLSSNSYPDSEKYYLLLAPPYANCSTDPQQYFFRETGRNITILYKPPKKSVLRKLVGEARQAPGIEAVPTNLNGVKRVIRNLRAGHTFGALPDQVPSRHGDGVWATFFGRAAYTITLPVKVAKQFDAIRIFAWGTRESHGWTLDAEEWDVPLTGDVLVDVEAMNRHIESIIRRMPAQYAWSYNRYKCPRGIARPAEAVEQK